MDIRRFAVSSSSAAALREAREAEQSKEAARVAACFADLGLPWPRPGAHRKVGRPALRTLYLESLDLLFGGWDPPRRRFVALISKLPDHGEIVADRDSGWEGSELQPEFLK